MIKITVETRRAILEETELITTGSVGIPVSFAFSSDWDGLSKVAVFRAGDNSDWYSIILTDENTVPIPWELLIETYEGEPLFVGVFGESAADHVLAIPTIWVSVGAIMPGAHTGNAESADPTPTQWSQIQMLANSAAEDAESARQSAEAAETFAEHGPSITDNYWYIWDGTEYVNTGQKAVGEDGEPGTDGFSPTISIAEIVGGHRIDVTNESGVDSFNVMDGETGATGPVGPAGIAVQNTAPENGVLAWLDTDGASVVSVPTYGELTAVDDKVGDGDLDPDFTATDLTGAVNELNSALTNLDAGGVEYDSTESYSSGTVGAELTSQKNTLTQLETTVGKLEVVVVSLSSPITFGSWYSNSNIEDDMVVLQSTIGTQSVQTADWTVTTGTGQFKIEGQSGTAATTLTLYFMKSR